MLLLELLGAPISKSGMEPFGVVDLVDELGKVVNDVLEGLVGHRIDGFNLQGLHEALGLGIVVRIAAAPHRADQAMSCQGAVIDRSGVLRAAVRMVNASRWRLAALDRDLERGNRQPGIDRAADRIADDPTRPGVEDDRDVDEACRDREVGDVGDP